jgi:hypothetical protein
MAERMLEQKLLGMDFLGGWWKCSEIDVAMVVQLCKYSKIHLRVQAK